ncbi:glycine betaine ABC transporter substrate-binding protein [Streptomyces sp. NPDC005917]|uniref:glycine betaine ABC transporter substrate-binding protein n=1 Tax=unclassified Streptomyces TaxID=2593676 RepID=UPI0033D9F0F5
MNRPQRRLGALLAALSFTAVCAGCSSTSGDLASSVSAGQLKGGSIAKTVDLSGKSFTVGSKEFKENPELKRLVQLLGDKLTQQAIIELNGMVDIDGASPQQAAVKFLKDEGFIA